MRLDYNPSTEAFILWAKRSEVDPDQIRVEYGLDWSETASTMAEAALFTREPYAAASFHAYATPRAASVLRPIITEIERSWASSDAHLDVPPDKELWPFQKGGIEYALSRPHTLIGDEPGLGKTMQAIVVANEMRAKRVLVVCPASLRQQWADRIKEWSTQPVTPMAVLMSARLGTWHDESPPAWVIVSWDLVSNTGLGQKLAMQHWDLMILDEAHYAKSREARRTRAIFGGGVERQFEPLATKAERILALTGTPLPNRPREAYVLARGLCWESIDFMSEDRFNDRFNPVRMGRTDSGKIWADERVGRASELQNRLRGHFMVRHLKREVMTQLRYPIYDIIHVEETEAVRAALQAESLLEIDPETLEGADIEVLGQIASARRQMGEAMAPQVVDYLNELAHEGPEKRVVFAWHISVLDIICERLAKHGVIRVDGSDDGRSKAAKVAKFIRDPAIKFIAGNVLSLGTGTDGLQHVSTHALIAEPDWVHGNNQQCIDRLDRGGQKGQVRADIFAARGSIAERVLASALRKAGVVHKALDQRPHTGYGALAAK